MERWVEIEDFPNYIISNEGRVSNQRTGRLLSPYLDKDGYLIVDIFNESGRHTKKVHRLVVKTFINPHLSDLEVNHKDTNKENNWASNLEEVTHLENMRHAIKTNRQPKMFRPVSIICLDTGEEFESLTEASRKTGAHLSAISAVVQGRRRVAKGLRFERIYR